MRVGIYARVSTLDNGQDPSLQTDELAEYCQRRGWTVAGQYVDRGISGSKDSRPELDRMMADARARRFDAVIVWKFDRFARSLKHLVNALADFEALGIAFVSLRDSVDLSTPQGRLMFAIIAAMSEFERSLIQERVRAGVARARAKGKVIGRPRETKLDVHRIGLLHSQGLTVRAIAAQIGKSKSAVHKIVSGLPPLSAAV